MQLLACVPLLFLLLLGCDRDAKKQGKAEDQRVKVAEKLLDKGKVDEAESLLQKAAADTTDPAVLFRLALSLQTQGKLEEATQALQRGLELAPKHGLMRLHLGTMQALLGKTDEARVQAEALMKDAPRSSAGPLLWAAVATPDAHGEAISNLARWRAAMGDDPLTGGKEALITLRQLHLLQGQPLAAQKLDAPLEKAELLNPPGALYLARMHLNQGRTALAEALLLAAAEADPALPVWGPLAAAAADLGHPATARRALGKLSPEARQTPAMQVVLGVVELSEGQAQQAVQTLRAAREKAAAPDGRADALFARALSAAGEDAEAIAVLQKAEAGGRLLPEGRMLLAELLHRGKDTAGAVAALQPLLNDDLHLDRAFEQLVRIHVQAGQLDAAREGLAAWRAKRPDHPQVRVSEAGILLAAGDAPGARKLLAEVVADSPGLVRAVDALVALHLQAEQQKQADAAVEAALSAARTPDMLDFAGAYFGSHGQPEKAERLFREALKIDSSDARPWARLARLLREQQKHARALPMYEEALKRHPNDVRLALEAAPLEAEAGKHAAAIAHYEQALAAGVTAPSVQNNLALLYADTGESLDRAQTLAEAARKQLPDSPQVLDTLGWVLHRRGQSGQARPLLQQAARGLPKSASAHYHLGMALSAAGETEVRAAVRALARALELDREHPAKAEIQQALAQLQSD